MNNTIETILQKTIKAPSGHNTQPWKFEVNENSITIFPDYERALPVVDTDNHALFISLGCALENLVIAAAHFGYDTGIEMHLESEGAENIKVNLHPSVISLDGVLYNYIDTRQATRNKYNANSIPSGDIEKLRISAVQEDVDCRIVTDKNEINTFIELVKEGNIRQFSNPSFLKELIHWIRFNKNEAMQTGDGLYGAATGNPSVPAWFGRLFMKLTASPKKEAEKWNELIHSSSALIIFIAERNDKKAWINVGRSFERAMLMAASLGINHAHANMPCEEVQLRKKLSDQLNLTKERQPLLLIRLGYSEKMPYSFRRPLQEVIIKDE
jgi:nitroreductase